MNPSQHAHTQTAREFLDTLTGHEENAIRATMGVDIYLDTVSRITELRALIFAHQRRDGLDDGAARTAALDLSFRDVQTYFAEPVIELDDDRPETESGNDVFGPA